MSYSSVLANFTNYKLDAVLVIDGIPVVFGSRAGRVHDGTGINGTTGMTLTSVNGFDIRSLKIGTSAMDKDGCMVLPSQWGMTLYIDSTWNKYFERRRTPNPVLTADLDETATSISVNDTTGYSDGDYIYINRETIKIGTVASGISLTGCTRNAIGLASNSAAAHIYGTSLGPTPRALLGREATLRIFVGHGDSDYQDFTGLKLSESPRYNLSAGVWELAFDDGMSRFARKICVNMQGTSITSFNRAASPGFFDLTPGEQTELTVNNGSDLGQVLLTAGDNGVSNAVPILADFTITSGKVRVKANAFTVNPADGAPNGPGSYSFMRRVYVFNRSPMEAALKVLLSDRGNQSIDSGGVSAGAYDVLVGPVSSTGGISSDGRLTDGTTERRLGAAIPAALIDIDTLVDPFLISMIVPGWFYVLGARGPESLLDFLEEVGWALGGFWYINSSGKLSFKLFEANYPTDTAAATITEGQLVREISYVSVDDEKDMLHTVNLDCNYSITDDKALGHFSAIWEEGRETYRDVPIGTITVKRKGLLVNLPNAQPPKAGGYSVHPASVDDVRTSLSRIYVKREKGTRKYVFDCPWPYSTLIAGDFITVTHSKFSAFDSNSVSSMTMQVMSRKPDIAKQRVQLTCEETWAGKLISPVGRVASWSGSGPTYTVVLHANDTKWGLGASPTSYFAAGWVVEIHKYGTGAARYQVTDNFTISTISSGTAMDVTNAGPSFTPGAKDIVCFRGYSNAASAVHNSAQGLGQRSYAFMARDIYLDLAATDAAELWG